MKKTILYCGYGWSGNIGNAFIDYGIRYLLNKIFPKDEIVYASNSAGLFKHKYTNGKIYNLFSKKQKTSFDIRNVIKADYYVLGGALLNKNWFDINSVFINYLVNTQKSVFLIGTSGGNDYGKEQVNYVKNILNKLNLKIFVSRDNETYEYYSECAKYTYNGIDNAFFLNNVFKPAKLNIDDYIISTFDHRKEPDEILKKHHNIFRLYHSSWNLGRLELILQKPKEILQLMSNNDMISDFPDDYLNLYANCNITYSDRVHACIATLIFGNKARYYQDSPRSLLFERIGLKDIKNKIVQLNLDYIEREKKEEIDYLCSTVTKIG